MTIRVSSITIYPVKSTAGLAVDSALVLPAGLRHDRRWMLVDEHGAFLTGRDHPRLVRVRVTPDADALLLEAPGTAPLRVERAEGNGEELDVEVWRDRVTAHRVSAAADAWFSAVLGLPCRLVHLPESHIRNVDPDHAEPGDRVSFADGYPLLLIGDASLDDLNRRTPIDAGMARFRPNLTVSGSEAFAEDGWRRIEVGEVVFEMPKLCDRCVMTTLDPGTGEKHANLEPLRTLATYRRDRERGILFGANLIPRSDGTVRVGDPVTVLQ